MLSGDGDDSINGNSGIDIVDFSTYTSAINLTISSSFTTSIYGTDTIVNVEGIKASTVNDTITGDSNTNIIYGMAGVDTLKGMVGNDTLYGGADDDTLFGGAGNDSIDGGNGSNDWVDYSDIGTTSLNVNLRAGTATGDGTDTLSLIEHIRAGNGTNTLQGDGNANSFVGGTGTDTLSYSGSLGAVTIALSSGTVSGSDGADIFSSIESFVGSGYADTFVNSTVWSGSIDGGTGSDTLDYSTYATTYRDW